MQTIITALPGEIEMGKLSGTDISGNKVTSTQGSVYLSSNNALKTTATNTGLNLWSGGKAFGSFGIGYINLKQEDGSGTKIDGTVTTAYSWSTVDDDFEVKLTFKYAENQTKPTADGIGNINSSEIIGLNLYTNNVGSAIVIDWTTATYDADNKEATYIFKSNQSSDSDWTAALDNMSADDSFGFGLTVNKLDTGTVNTELGTITSISIPEPATFGLIGLAGAGLVAYRRRKQF